MKLARLLLLFGALLLLATAAFHGSGGSMVSGWLEGNRGRILSMLWFVPAIDWAVVAALWIYAAWRPDAHLRVIVWVSALIPMAVALMLIAAVGAGFPGTWMLIGAAALASAGAARLSALPAPPSP